MDLRLASPNPKEKPEPLLELAAFLFLKKRTADKVLLYFRVIKGLLWVIPASNASIIKKKSVQ